MLQFDNTTVSFYIYSGIAGLTNWSLEISKQKGRETVTQIVALNVLLFGGTYYELQLDPPPTLDPGEYEYKLKAGNDIIKKGILRYGAI